MTADSSSTLFDHLKALQLPSGEFAVFGSGPLLVRGIITDSPDLDVIVRSDAWDDLARDHGSRRTREFDVDLIEITRLVGGSPRVLSFGREWRIGDVDVDALIDDAEMIDDLPFVRLHHVLAYKRLLGRPKDLEHLRLAAAAGHV